MIVPVILTGVGARTRIDTAEHRARLAGRHRLAPSARVHGAADVAHAMAALHATDPATPYLSPVMHALEAVEVDLRQTSGWVPGDDLERDADSEPWVSLLPALDPTLMGSVERAWFLGDTAPAIFDRTGNVGPTVWCDGRIAGGWAWLGDARVTPRFHTPLERELSA